MSLAASLPPPSFAAPVLMLDAASGRFVQHWLPLSPEVVEALRNAGHRRLVGTLNGVPIRLAQHTIEGQPGLLLSRQTLRAARARPGDTLQAVLQPDPTPDAIELGEEFAEVLLQDEAAAARFHSLTLGRQRGLAHYATSAKTPETRLKRALELARKLRTNTLYGDQK